jgi:hypothetical protein
MPNLLKFAAGLLLSCTFFAAFADEREHGIDASHWCEEGNDAFRWREYKRAYIAWRIGAGMGDSEQQELVADLLLGPHAYAVKHQRYEGMHYLYRAAIGGRRTAMLKLSDALSTGSLGAKKSPEAAKCWSKAPVDFERRLHCVALTDFRDRHARASCSELVLLAGENRINEQDGAPLAKLCLANKTPALLVPGLPPSAQELQREREYARRGIEWVVTGDVYNRDFEKFRERFNATIVEAIEAERGRGYLERLYEETSTQIAKNRQ